MPVADPDRSPRKRLGKTPIPFVFAPDLDPFDSWTFVVALSEADTEGAEVVRAAVTTWAFVGGFEGYAGRRMKDSTRPTILEEGGTFRLRFTATLGGTYPAGLDVLALWLERAEYWAKIEEDRRLEVAGVEVFDEGTGPA